MINTIIDFHCHPSMKPYGKSFASDRKNSANKKDKKSIWHYDAPGLMERGLQMASCICKFTQTDFTSLAYGNVQIVCAALYPVERGFFKGKLGTGTLPSDVLNGFVTGLGKARIDYIQQGGHYFEDLENEYDFYRQLEGVKVKTDAGVFTYRMVCSFADIENYYSEDVPAENTLFIIPAIEGMHSLHNDIDHIDEVAVLANLDKVKAWKCPPFMVSMAHHFYNHLCGHAQSLTDLVGKVTDQSEGLRSGITPLGYQVIRKLLAKSEHEKRILIDIKHMSTRARQEYFHLLKTDYGHDPIPVIVSHGAANGMRSVLEPVQDRKETAFKLNASEINFYDEEIILVAQTGGLFCLQLDERRIASEATLKSTKHAIPINKIRHYRAELFWNQVQHIAELLDSRGLFAWDCMAIGSDFDGIINPLNGYLTAETYQQLLEFTERYAFNYMSGRGKEVLQPFNRIEPSEIVNRIFTDNGVSFLRRWFQ
ncbi:MAG TPA: membrane dipeptidase [Chitinophagaceae bacterium]|nr:membrane dipeptidase [Chitinophagaceae bacterium]